MLVVVGKLKKISGQTIGRDKGIFVKIMFRFK